MEFSGSFWWFNFTLVSGSINSFCYDQESGNVMLTFAPSQHHETVTHILYSLDLDSEHKKLLHIHTYRSLSKKLTRVIRSAFWTTPHGPLAAVYDEANSHVVCNTCDFLLLIYPESGFCKKTHDYLSLCLNLLHYT